MRFVSITKKRDITFELFALYLLTFHTYIYIFVGKMWIICLEHLQIRAVNFQSSDRFIPVSNILKQIDRQDLKERRLYQHLIRKFHFLQNDDHLHKQCHCFSFLITFCKLERIIILLFGCISSQHKWLSFLKKKTL